MNYTDLIWELNESLDGNKEAENQGLTFTLTTNNFWDVISLGDLVLYNSEEDSLHDHETDTEISLKEVIRRNLNKHIDLLLTIKL